MDKRFQLDLTFVWDDDDVRPELADSELQQMIAEFYKNLIVDQLNRHEKLVSIESRVQVRR